jgi:hypothetical protein
MLTSASSTVAVSSVFGWSQKSRDNLGNPFLQSKGDKIFAILSCSSPGWRIASKALYFAPIAAWFISVVHCPSFTF